MQPPPDLLPCTVLSCRDVWSGRYLKLEARMVTTSAGPREIEVARAPDGVGVIALLSDGTIPMVWQWRPAIGRACLEIPAGIVDPGETPAQAAERELAEEAGWTANRWTHLLRHTQAEGWSDAWVDLWLAEDCHPKKLPCDPGEDLFTVRLTRAELLRALEDGTVVDPKTQLAARIALVRTGTAT